MVEGSNITASMLGLFIGRNPVRALFAEPRRLNLRWTSRPEPVPAGHGTDLCGKGWPITAPPGAFADFRDCVAGVRR